jgi:hypothetical protein
VDKHNDPFRLKISASQVELLREVLANSPPSVIDTGERIARGEVVQRPDAEAVADVLTEAFNDEDIYENGPTARGKEIDALVSVALQASHDFYD